MPRAVRGSCPGILSRDPRAEESTHLLLGPLGLSAASFPVREHKSCSSFPPNPHPPTDPPQQGEVTQIQLFPTSFSQRQQVGLEGGSTGQDHPPALLLPGSLCQSRPDGCPCQLGGHSPLQARLHLPANNPVLPSTSALCPHTCPSLLAAPGGLCPLGVPGEAAGGTPRPEKGRMATWRRDRGCQIT